MVVDAVTENCGPLTAVGGMTLSDTAGMLASGVAGVDISNTANTLTWPAAANGAQAGQVVRVTRATGTFDDYDGVGYFGDESRSAEEKGPDFLAGGRSADTDGHGRYPPLGRGFGYQKVIAFISATYYPMIFRTVTMLYIWRGSPATPFQKYSPTALVTDMSLTTKPLIW